MVVSWWASRFSSAADAFGLPPLCQYTPVKGLIPGDLSRLTQPELKGVVIPAIWRGLEGWMMSQREGTPTRRLTLPVAQRLV
jgi:hypothetical protein